MKAFCSSISGKWENFYRRKKKIRRGLKNKTGNYINGKKNKNKHNFNHKHCHNHPSKSHTFYCTKNYRYVLILVLEDVFVHSRRIEAEGSSSVKVHGDLSILPVAPRHYSSRFDSCHPWFKKRRESICKLSGVGS